MERANRILGAYSSFFIAIQAHIKTASQHIYTKQIQKAKRMCNFLALQWKLGWACLNMSALLHSHCQTPLFFFTSLFLPHLIDRRPLSPHSLLNRDYLFKCFLKHLKSGGRIPQHHLQFIFISTTVYYITL